MSLSKECGEPVSPFSLWETSYEFLTSNIKLWAMNLFEMYINHEKLIDFVTEFTSLVINLITSGILIFSTNSKLVMTISGIGFFSNFYNTFKKLFQIFNEFNPQQAMSEFYTSLIAYKEQCDTKVYPNSEDAQTDWFEHVKVILTSFFSAIVGGLGYVLGGFKGIGNAFRTLTSAKIGISNIKDIIDKTMAQVVLNKVDPIEKERQDITELVDRAQELNRMSIGDIVCKNDNVYKLKQIVKEINQVLGMYKSPDTYALRTVLINLTRELNKKLQEIHHIVPARQVTTGVLFIGEKAVGKSSLIRHMAKVFNQWFGYSESIYNLNCGVNFFEPYHNQDIGVVDEFQSTTEKEVFVMNANRLISGDPFNLEGASLESKVGDCKLKVVGITSNTKNPALSELKHEAIGPFYDRLIIIEVVDKQVSGRRKIYTHRKPDFSHLTFSLKEVSGGASDPYAFNTLYDELSIHDVLHVIGCKVAMEMIRFHENMGIDLPAEHRDKIIELANPVPGTYPFKYFCFEEIVTPNDEGRNFCILRLQGIEGTGKTTTARKLAKRWINLTADFSGETSFVYQESFNLSEFKPLAQPCVYILDDWVSLSMPLEDQKEYVGKINATDPRSIFIITTNEIIEYQHFSKNWFANTVALFKRMPSQSYYDLTDYDDIYTGMFRRIGLDNFYVTPKGCRKTASTEYARTITIDKKARYFYKERSLGETQILESMKQAYLAMVRDRFSITIVRERPQNEEITVDMELVVESSSILFRNLRSAVLTSKMYLKPSHGAKLTISDRILKGLTNLGRLVNPKDFMVDELFPPETPTDQIYFTIVERMVRVLLRYYKEPTFRISVRESGEVIYYDNGVAYYYNTKDIAYIVQQQDRVMISLEEPKTITAEQFAKMLCAKDISERFSSATLSINEYVELEKFYRQAISTENHNEFTIKVATHESEIKKYQQQCFTDELKKQSRITLLKIGIAGIIGISSLGALYGLYKLISSHFNNQGEPINANAFANVGSTPPKRTEQAQSERNAAGMGVDIIANSPYTKKQSQIYANSPYTKKQSQIYANSPYTKNKSQLYIHANNVDHNKTPHEHLCKACNSLYSHIHKYSPKQIHPQWNKQCPNPECPEYHEGNDKLQTILIETEFSQNRDEPKHPYSLARLLGEAFSPIHGKIMRVLASCSERKRSNIYDAIWQAHKNDIDPIEVIKKYPELHDLLHDTVVANMLSLEDMIINAETGLQVLHRKLQACYVRINVEWRSAYAIHVGQGFFLTISHFFKENGEYATLCSNGIRYSAQCVALVRNRDISVIYCKQLMSTPSAKRYFIKDCDNLAPHGFFLRCGPTFEVVSGALEYKAYQEHLDGTSDVGDLYSPTTEIIKLRRIGFNTCSVVRKGDCGMPFCVELPDGSFRVAGIHNAYKIKSVIFGGLITQVLIEDLCDLTITNATQQKELSPCSVVSIPVIKEYKKTTLRISLPFEYVNVIQTSQKPDPYLPIDIPETTISLGYAPQLQNWGQLKEKHLTHDFKLENPCLTLPAAYNMNYVTDTSKLIKDGLGRPSPLWTQACKYEIQEQQWDPDIMDHAIHLCLEYNKLTYASEPLRVLTEFEAINGTRNPFLSNVDITTSAGPYARYFYKVFTKREIFDVDMSSGNPIYSFNSTEAAQNIRNHLKHQTRLLEEELISPALFSQDNAKVEVISAQKAREGKVRLFNNVDPNVNAILKRYFGDWFAHVMEKHKEGYYAVGQDPYITSTEIYHSFEQIHGKILNTDFSAFDKLLIPKLIHAFCYIGSQMTRTRSKHTQKHHEAIYGALADTLTHAIHSLNGSLYVVNNGNESGTFVTTLLNCVAVHIIFNYTFIKMWNKVPAYVSIYIDLKTIMSLSTLRILGDDKTQKVNHKVPMTEQDLIDIAQELGMKCTPAKGDSTSEEQINFCSRVLVFDEYNQVVRPKLKWESVVGLSYWFASLTPTQLRDNALVQLFEAALHGPEQHASVLRDLHILAPAFGLDMRTVPFTSYDICIRRLRSFVMNDTECQKISALANRETSYVSSSDYSRLLKQHLLSENNIYIDKINGDLIESPLTSKKSRPLTKNEIIDENTDPMASGNPNNNSISRAFELISKLQKPLPRETYSRDGPAHSPTYSCTINFENREFGGEGPSKADAKNRAFGCLEKYLLDNITANAASCQKVQDAETAIASVSKRAFSLYIERHIKTAKNNTEGKRYIVLVSSTPIPDDAENIDGFHCFYSNGRRYILSSLIKAIGSKETKTCYLRYPGLTLDEAAQEITLDVHDNTSLWCLRTLDAKDYSDQEDLIYANSLECEMIENIVLNRNGKIDNAIESFKDDIYIMDESTYLKYVKTLGNGITCYDERNADYIVVDTRLRKSFRNFVKVKLSESNYKTVFNTEVYQPEQIKDIIKRIICQPLDETIHANADPNATPIMGLKENDIPPVETTNAALNSDHAIEKPILMNPSGVPNQWLSAGGITHNIMDEAYNQFVYTKQKAIASGALSGSVIFKIPYQITNNEYTTASMQNLALMHERCAGDWQVKVTCTGGPLTGEAMIFWAENMPEGEIMSIEEATRIAYYTNSISIPWSQTIVMRDVRKTDFYRTIPRNSTKTPIEPNQPCIVLFMVSPAESNFKEKANVYFNVYAKFCSQKDQLFNPNIKPFVLANPKSALKYNPDKGYSLNF